MANINKVSLPDGTTYNFKDDVSGYIDSRVYTGRCNTNNNSADKTATLYGNSANDFELGNGTVVILYCENPSYNSSLTYTPITMSVQNTTATPIMIDRYSQLLADDSANGWASRSTIMLYYYGNVFYILSNQQSVQWDQLVSSGTNIADVTIGGTTTHIYAPSGGGSVPNNGVLTIQKNGSTIQTFSADQSTNVTADISVPTQASDIGAQPTLSSGTNIKTVNGFTLLGSGNLQLSYGADEIEYSGDIPGAVDVENALDILNTAVDGKMDYVSNGSLDEVLVNNGSGQAIGSQVSISTLLAKQDELQSGTNIKTINGNSILGSGNLAIPTGSTVYYGTTEPASSLGNDGDLYILLES